MTLKTERFINELMNSNCYIVVEWDSKHCVCIDPGSEEALRETAFIKGNGLTLDYIILTHEHTDHTWGANALKQKFPEAKLVCSEMCEKNAKKSSKAYFLLYYNRKGYRYELLPADVLIKSNDDLVKWEGCDIHFLMTPGHSHGSMCIDISGELYTGDTIMPYEPYFNGKDGNEEDWKKSVALIQAKYLPEMIVYPGHGETFELGEAREFYRSYFEKRGIRV